MEQRRRVDASVREVENVRNSHRHPLDRKLTCCLGSHANPSDYKSWRSKSTLDARRSTRAADVANGDYELLQNTRRRLSLAAQMATSISGVESAILTDGGRQSFDSIPN